MVRADFLDRVSLSSSPESPIRSDPNPRVQKNIQRIWGILPAGCPVEYLDLQSFSINGSGGQVEDHTGRARSGSGPGGRIDGSRGPTAGTDCSSIGATRPILRRVRVHRGFAQDLRG